MSIRLTITLPEETVSVLDRVAGKGGRSRFINQAVLNYVEVQGKRNLRRQLEIGYRTNATLDLEMASE